MISIPERFLVSAVPVDGGERVTGQVLHAKKDRAYLIPSGEVMQIYKLGFAKVDKVIKIDPETIEPVKARVIETESYEQCPNCKSNNISFMRTNDYSHPPEPFQCDYCPDCGQALDWGGGRKKEEA